MDNSDELTDYESREFIHEMRLFHRQMNEWHGFSSPEPTREQAAAIEASMMQAWQRMGSDESPEPQPPDTSMADYDDALRAALGSRPYWSLMPPEPEAEQEQTDEEP